MQVNLLASKTTLTAMPITVGNTVTFHLLLNNLGNVPLHNIVVSDVFDSTHLTFVSATVTPTSILAGQLSWNTGVFGNLAAGSAFPINVTFNTTRPNSTMNQMLVSANDQ